MKAKGAGEIFVDLLPTDMIRTDRSSCEFYGADTSKNFTGEASVVLFPRTTEQVQAIVRRCCQERLAIIPSGGRTGLCGGATATEGEVVLSLEKMNAIGDIQPSDRLVVTEAGVTTQRLKEKAGEFGLDFPVNLASWGSSQIGGNIATNAGGMHVIRYGDTRKWVLALTVVTGDGTILRTGKSLQKDNTGYDLKNLFIGSEGTLGVITEATIALTRKPPVLTHILCGVNHETELIDLLQRCHGELKHLAAFEFFTKAALAAVIRFRSCADPFEKRYPFYALLELEETATPQLEEFLMEGLSEGIIQDVVIAQNSKQSQELLALRESISETLSSHFTPYKCDISVPVSTIPPFLTELAALFAQHAPDYELVPFGHVGDGNVHVNWLKPEGESREKFFERSKLLDRHVLNLVTDLHGSISAEHGIGLLKRDVLHLSRSPEELAYMKAIKQTFDPHGILNPGKVLE
ncbi:FAD-binding oxidoreductase [bacterium]|nr:FAD-binding oxidoreductase [bacterium]